MERLVVSWGGLPYEVWLHADDPAHLKGYRWDTEWQSSAVWMDREVRRVCNVHNRFLARPLKPSRRKGQARAYELLTCPHAGCDVGVWSEANNSTPAVPALRTLRQLVFRCTKESGVKLGVLSVPEVFLGHWNGDECYSAMQQLEDRFASVTRLNVEAEYEAALAAWRAYKISLSEVERRVRFVSGAPAVESKGEMNLEVRRVLDLD